MNFLRIGQQEYEFPCDYDYAESGKIPFLFSFG